MQKSYGRNYEFLKKKIQNISDKARARSWDKKAISELEAVS